MDTNELLKKIKLIEIKTRGLTKQVFSGAYHSSFKGKGMAFSEVREYNVGDEVRTIDWNVTARFNAPFVKVFEEERELTVILMIDVSGSSEFGTQNKTKKDLALELAAVLAFSAIANNDKIGAIFVSDRIEKYIAPAKGKKHALYILRELIALKPKSLKTNINEGLKFLRNTQKKRSIGFVISDFIDSNSFQEGFNVNKRKHDLVAIRLSDPAESKLPNLGMIHLYNAETNRKTWVNSSSVVAQKIFEENFRSFENQLNDIFKQLGVDQTTIQTTDDYIPKLMQLFHTRK